MAQIPTAGGDVTALSASSNTTHEQHNGNSPQKDDFETEPSAIEKETELTDTAEDKDVEAAAPALLASENYSVFTVPQKRAIVVAGSFLGLFSPVSLSSS